MDENDRFRDLIERDDIAVLPGCYDALSAKILEKAGFDAVYLSGAGVSNTKLGIADTGFVTQTEMRRRIEYVTDAISIPLFSDADEGYGNPLHVRRTVQAYEREGASALHVEDQAFPKKCGHFEDKELLSTEEMRQKVEAALDAREDPAFTIVARTDARAVEGVDAAIERANAYADAGADVIFPEAPQTREEMARFCEEIDAPVMANMVEYGKTPMVPAEELEAIGFDLVIFPNSLLRAAMTTMVDVAEHIDETGTTGDILDQIASFDLRNELTDYERVKELERRYA
ncbi:MAG: isocitrate lyase/PEP mutase family protein [Haloferacaceae archaeon]